MRKLASDLASAVGYRHVVLSPHFDDAALSLGATLARHARAGEPVLVITVCSAVPAAATPLTPIVAELHGLAGLEAVEYVRARRREDERAMALLGADHLWLEELDAIYRAPASYPDVERLFAPPAEDDDLAERVTAAVAPWLAALPEARLYAPLAVGGHVDHELVHRAAGRLGGRRLVYYEDLPYALEDEALAAALRRRPGLSAELIEVEAALEHKLAAVAAYATQVPMLFGGATEMRARLSRHARIVASASGTHAERLWNSNGR